jgi:hypothetical protein
MPSPLPRWDRWVLVASRGVTPSSPATAAFPVSVAGRLPHYPFRGLLGVHSRYGLPARGVAKRPFPSKAPTASSPPPPLRLLPAGTTRVAGRELHPLKKQNQSAPDPQLFSTPTDRPIVSVSAWLALADWFQRHQSHHGALPCDSPREGSPPIPCGRPSIRSGPESPSPLGDAASNPSGPTDPDLASPPAAAPPGPDRRGGRS